MTTRTAVQQAAIDDAYASLYFEATEMAKQLVARLADMPAPEMGIDVDWGHVGLLQYIRKETEALVEALGPSA
ncbi:MAG: hypothetical protein AB7U73_20660 [Pirellulales bacterium]